MPDSQKIKTFHSLLHYTHMRKAKEDLLAGYNVDSTLELSDRQLDELISYLRDLMHEKEVKVESDLKKARHQCLKIMSDIGVDTQDWNNVNEFMLNKHVCGRHLYELNMQDLKAFQRKLYAIKTKVAEKREQEKRLTSMN